MARVLLLVPSATYRAADFLEAARALGVDVVVGSEEPHVLAGRLGAGTMVVPLDDPELGAQAIVAHDRLAPLDAVVAVDDQGTVVAAEAARRLGLKTNPPDAVAAARDKARLRAALAAAEVPQPAFAVAPPGADDHAVAELAARVGFPCVVKPTTLSGSQGVLRADNEAELMRVAARVRAIARQAGAGDAPPLLVERFVGGPEVAVEGLLVNGSLEVLAVFDKPDGMDGPAFEETLYVTPSRLPPADVAAAVAALDAGCRALGLAHGPVHGELRVGGGRAWIIEVAARTIGGLCARTLRFGAGRSLEELVLADALGLALPPTAPASPAAGVLMIPIPRAGTLVELRGVEAARAVDGVTAVEVAVAPGRPVAPPPEGNRYLGFVFARGNSAGEVERQLRTAWGHLEVVVADDPGATTV